MLHWIERLLNEPVELNPSEAYKKWASNYPPYAHNELMKLEERAVLDLLPETTAGAALDLGCGSGRYLRILRARGSQPVFGLDLSRPMLVRARSHGADLVQSDIELISMKTAGLYLVVCALALGHIRDLRSAMREISRILVPGGTVIYSEIHPNGSRLGWRRTFRGNDGVQYSVRSNLHTVADHLNACGDAGLMIEAVREPAVDFQRKWRGLPALIVIRARKPSL